jgi:predicted nucleic acid-binding protein
VILVDTSAWIQHLRNRDLQLVELLRQERVRTCDVVIGELMLGSGLPKGLAQDLGALPRLSTPNATETRHFIERHIRTFAGSGVGWSDVQIIAAAVKAGARLHSTDRAVRKVCRLLRVPLI